MQPSLLESTRLRPSWGPLVWLVAGGLGLVEFATSVAATPLGSPVATVAGLTDSWGAFTDWVAGSYQRAPALVLGLAVLLLVPPLALIGLYFRRKETEGLEVAELETQVRRPYRPPLSAEPRDGVRTGHIPLRPQEAWVEIVNADEVASGEAKRRYGLSRTLLRIGRETDNDICLTDTTVHRYHAAIHRTEDAEFVITDLSSAGGNGVVVNGRAVAEARLANGDTIELGNARLRFSAAPSV